MVLEIGRVEKVEGVGWSEGGKEENHGLGEGTGVHPAAF